MNILLDVVQVEANDYTPFLEFENGENGYSI